MNYCSNPGFCFLNAGMSKPRTAKLSPDRCGKTTDAARRGLAARAGLKGKSERKRAINLLQRGYAPEEADDCNKKCCRFQAE